jgi:putative transposase
VRDLGISQGTFYKWQQKYGGMEASDVKRLKDLELENSRLKRLLADTILDKEIVKDVIEKKAGARRAAGAHHVDSSAL